MSRIPIESEMERAIDSRRYRDRNDLMIANANMFIANNNNPFLVSPYSPPTNVAKASAVQSISSIIANLITGLSTVINLTDFTLSISTIEPVVTDISQTVTITGDILNINSNNTNFEFNTFFNTISTGYIFASNANVSSLIVSSLNVDVETANNFIVNSTLTASTITTKNLYFSTLIGDSITTNYLTVNSTLTASTITTKNLNFTTLLGDSITTNYLTVNSTLTASTITTKNLNFTTLLGDSITTNYLTVNSTLTASTITTNFLTVNSVLSVSSLNAASSIITKDLTFSSIFMEPGHLSTATTLINSSFIISIGGTKFRIPLELI
jgi:hypothetical protein